MKQILLCVLLYGALGVSAQVRYAIVRTEGAAVYDGSLSILISLSLGDTVFVGFKQDVDAQRPVEYRGIIGFMKDSDLSEVKESKDIVKKKYNKVEAPTKDIAPIVQPVEKNGRTEEYCLIIGTAKFFSTKVVVSIDFGQETEFFDSNRYKDESGNVVNFNSMVDALNYMNSKGWVFMNAYPMSSGNGTAYHYLMKRAIK